MGKQRTFDRGEHDLGRPRGGPRDVHAGGLRLPRGRADAHEERGAHRRQERPDLRASARSSTTPSASGSPSATANSFVGTSGFFPSSQRAARDRPGAVLGSSRDPGAQRATCSRSSSRASRSRSSGARWPSGRSSGSTSPSASSSRSSTRSCRTGSGARRLAVRQGHAGLRRLHGRALPGRARRARRCAPARAADRQVRPRRTCEPDPGPQHALRRARDDHPLVRLVRLQPRLDARRRSPASIGYFAYVALTTNIAAAAGAVGGLATRLARCCGSRTSR